MFWHNVCRSLFLLLASASGAAILQRPLRADGFYSSLEDSTPLAKLRAVVENRLIYVEPIAKPCYGLGSSTTDECLKVQGNKTDDIWTTDQPGGYFYSNWASCQATDQTCAIAVNSNEIPPGKICHQGSVPRIMVEIKSTDTLVRDIEAAFVFANTTGAPLVIKNTGHDWKGRSTGPDSLALWTHNLRHPIVPIVLNRNFTPIGCLNCTPETVFHYGPGQQWGGAYEFAEKNNLTVVGGTCRTVGIAGWLHSGGHSPLTPAFGMGADNLRQVEIVTPHKGKIVASESHNSDVFFAVRGGGGGTFGVITNITYKAIPRFEVQDLHYTFNHVDTSNMRQYLNILTSNAVAWSERGWGGYIGSNDKGQYATLVNPKLSFEDAKADMKPLIEFLEAQDYNYTFKTQPSWYRLFEEVFKPASVHPALWSSNPVSRLLPKRVFEGRTRDKLVGELMQMHDDKLFRVFMFVAPTSFAHTKTAALHPSWKDAVLSLRVNDRWDQFYDNATSSPARSHFKKVHQSFAGIRDLTPDMGVSITEADIWEENHELRFWGKDKYERLLTVKNQVDPHNILSTYQAVKWNPDDVRYRCYPKPVSKYV